MSNTAPRTPSTETSVTFSLAELAKLEQERVREEETAREKAREREARERREAAARAREAEAAALQAAEEARQKRLRAEAEEQARAEARLRAAADVARIEAESRARIEAQNAARAHELAVLEVQQRSSKRIWQIAFAAALGLALAGGALGGHWISQKADALALDLSRAREAQQALARERESAKQTELAALDRRYTALMARTQKGAEEARAGAEMARKAVDRKALDHDRLRAFADALDALSARLDTLDRLAMLDHRRDDLLVWADEKKREGAGAAVRTAAVRARAIADDGALRGYEGALDHLRDELARAQGGKRGVVTTGGDKGTACIDANDPMCGLNGKSL